MNCVFADTSFYVALANPRDVRHRAAVDAGDRWNGPVMTTEYVLVELGNYLRGPSGRKVFVDLVQTLGEDAQTTVIPASAVLFGQGFRLYAARLDKGWSLTDCISSTVMESHGIIEALAYDHHFEQADFRALLLR
ncbi:MAG TPA: PIN domain-containing protein [Candidatus Hydrogenedentes bacterium]|nr:PIN domain-containing protein [Candidatus Hydrogenedentota bacterium]HPG66384.1 PIN domain-containing protein [Candidatus Hydrogenedentota bacterium]